jgi:hypothetical protein
LPFCHLAVEKALISSCCGKTGFYFLDVIPAKAGIQEVRFSYFKGFSGFPI